MRSPTAVLAPLALLSLGATLVPLAARAQQRPPLSPTRDVAVTYQMSDGQQTMQQTMRWLPQQQLMRVDPPSPGMYMIVNYRARQLEIVRTSDRQVMDIPAPPGPAGAHMPGELPGTSYRQVGSATVAGVPCTEWATTDSAGQPATTCISADGVLLRAQSGGRTLLQATQVSYGPQNPQDFQIPAGYTHVAPPPDDGTQGPGAPAGQAPPPPHG